MGTLDQAVCQEAGHQPAALSAHARQSAPSLAYIGLLASGLLLCAWIARPFAGPIAWAAALAVIGAPLHRLLERRVPGRGLAAGCSVLLVALALVLIAGLLLPRLAREMYAGVVEIRSWVQAGAWNDAIARHEWSRVAWEWLTARVDLHDLTERAGAIISANGPLALRWSVVTAIELVLVFFFLFYFLRDRERFIAGLRALLPVADAAADRILESARATIFATLYGKVVIGAVQGLLGGLMFWWLEIPAAGFWAVLMGVLSIMPLVGAPLIWVPAAALLLLEGRWEQASVLAIWGAFVVGLADNVLYPIVVGRYLRLHTLLLLVSLIGGIVVFGSPGLFVGPVILAVTAALLEIRRDEATAVASAPPMRQDHRSP